MSKILQKDVVDFLESKKKLFESHAAISGDTYVSRTAIHIYSDCLDYLKKPTTTSEGLRKRLVDLRPTPQSVVPFVCYGLAAVACEEDVIHFIENGKPLIPHDLTKVPAFFKEFQAKLDREKEEQRKRQQQRWGKQQEKEQEEVELRARKEHLASLGLDRETLQSMLAEKPETGG